MKKYAVITGASSGIGMEFAKKLAKKGYALILVARREDRLRKLAKSLPAECRILCADLTSQEECRRVYRAVADKPVEIFINNAGFGDCGHFLETDWEKERQMIRVNAEAVHYFTKQMLQKMQESNHGYILNVASCAGLFPAGPYMAAYYATKAYVASLTRAVAEELKEQGSRVYVGCLCPGPVDTEFNEVANVEFVLKGISAAACVRSALSGMRRRKVLIVPSLRVKFAVTAGRFIPAALLIRLTAGQQKKKRRR